MVAVAQTAGGAPPAELYEAGVRTACELAITRSTRNPYRTWNDWELPEQQRYWGWALIEVQLRQAEEPHVDRSFEVYTAKSNLELLEREMARRRNLTNDSGKHPDLGPDRRKWVDYERVKDVLRIEYVVDHLTQAQLHRHGSILKTNCFLPGHADDHTPSFVVWPASQTFKCFGCGRGGDVIELARHWFSQDNAAVAVEHLCTMLGIDVPRQASMPLPTGPRITNEQGRIVPINPDLLIPRRLERR